MKIHALTMEKFLLIETILLVCLANRLSSATAVSFDYKSYSTNAISWELTESITNGRLYVNRFGDTNQAISIDYATIDGTAVAGTDYIAQTSTLAFAAGQAIGVLTIPLIDNGRVDGRREFRVRLSNPSPGVDILASEAIVTIRDNEIPVFWDRSFQIDPDLFPAQRVCGGEGGFITPLPALLIQRDGKILTTEFSASWKQRVVCLNPDGTVDASLRSSLPWTYNSVLALDGQGRVFVAGAAARDGQRQTVLVRLLPDGSTDRTFSAADWPILPGTRVLLAVQGDDHLLVGASNRLWRFKPNGALDENFTSDLEPRRLETFAVLPDDRLLVSLSATNQSNACLLYRLEASGQIDPTFHTAALAGSPAYWPTIADIKIQSDGKILVGGAFSSVDDFERASIVRLHADGLVDPSFDPPPSTVVVRAMLIDKSARVLVAGAVLDSRGYGYVQWGMRLQSNGSLDTNFPTLYQVESNWNILDVNRLALQADGKLLVAGELSERTGMFCEEFRPFVGRAYSEMPTNTLEFTQPQFTTSESQATALITVRRIGDTSGSATVRYATGDGSALAGDDYLPATGLLTFAPLETERTFTISLLDDAEAELPETVSLTLSEAMGVAVIGLPKAQLFIADDDSFGFLRPPRIDEFPTLKIYGEPGVTYALESVSSLDATNAWQTVATVTLQSHSQAVTDWRPTDVPSRLYRLRRVVP